MNASPSQPEPGETPCRTPRRSVGGVGPSLHGVVRMVLATAGLAPLVIVAPFFLVVFVASVLAALLAAMLSALGARRDWLRFGPAYVGLDCSAGELAPFYATVTAITELLETGEQDPAKMDLAAWRSARDSVAAMTVAPSLEPLRRAEVRLLDDAVAIGRLARSKRTVAMIGVAWRLVWLGCHAIALYNAYRQLGARLGVELDLRRIVQWSDESSPGPSAAGPSAAGPPSPDPSSPDPPSPDPPSPDPSTAGRASPGDV